MSLSTFFEKAKTLPKQRLVVVAPEDEFVLSAVKKAKNAELVTPILIGNKNAIIDKLTCLEERADQYQIIDANPEEVAELAVKMIKEGNADILMKGLIDTRTLLKAVVNSEKGIKAQKLLSHIAVFSFPSEKYIIASDCAMNINPGIEEKKGIIENAAEFAQRIGIKHPKIALISATEKPNPKLGSSMDAVELTRFYKSEENFLLEGPFALDNIFSSVSREHKNIESKVAESTDILIFPNLDSGNVFYKSAVFLGHAQAAGLIVGAKAPIVLTSRADSEKSKLNSIVLAMVYNYGLQNTSY